LFYAQLYLLASVFHACEVGSAWGIAIKAFSEFLKRWTCAHIVIQLLLTFAYALLLYLCAKPLSGMQNICNLFIVN
jgi:NhaP-type Na+/H+ or K+/H+ antiporter